MNVKAPIQYPVNGEVTTWTYCLFVPNLRIINELNCKLIAKLENCDQVLSEKQSPCVVQVVANWRDAETFQIKVKLARDGTVRRRN